jgi:hypothetical protein
MSKANPNIRSPNNRDIISGADLVPPRAPFNTPASLLSAATHALIFITFAVLWRQQTPRQLTEPDRMAPVTIALVRPNKVEYIAFDEPSPVEQIEEVAGTVEGGGPLPASFTDAGPALPDSLSLPVPRVASANIAYVPAPQTTPRGSVSIPSTTDYSDYLATEAARLRAKQPQGDPVELSLFGGPKALGRSFVFVIDRSKSMHGSGISSLKAAQNELSYAIEQLEPVHRFTIIAYNQAPTYLGGWQLISATSENRERVVPFLSGLAPVGQTEHEMALLAALRLEPDVVFLFTDGGDPELRDPQIKYVSRAAAEQGSTIHCIQFGQGPLKDRSNFLARLARDCSGGFTYVDMSP